MPRKPSTGPITSPFGIRNHPITGERRMHNGVDTVGVGNFAPVTGTVVFADFDRTGTGLGYVVGIREAANPRVIWWVGHHAALAVEVGHQALEGATYLGPLGDSGFSAGPHAHTERRVGGTATPGTGVATDPVPYFNRIRKTPAPRARRRPSMATLRYTTTTDKKSTRLRPQPILERVLVGDGSGAAAVIDIPTQDEFADLALVHGSAVWTPRARMAELRKVYAPTNPTT